MPTVETTKPARRAAADALLMKLAFLDEPPAPDTLLAEELGLDSLRLVELLVNLEETCRIEFTESDVNPARVRTVADVYALLER